MHARQALYHLKYIPSRALYIFNNCTEPAPLTQDLVSSESTPHPKSIGAHTCVCYLSPEVHYAPPSHSVPYYTLMALLLLVSMEAQMPPPPPSTQYTTPTSADQGELPISVPWESGCPVSPYC